MMRSPVASGFGTTRAFRAGRSTTWATWSMSASMWRGETAACSGIVSWSGFPPTSRKKRCARLPLRDASHGCCDRRRDLHVEPGAPWVDREALRAVDEADRAAQTFRQAGLEELPRRAGVKPADVDAVDLHAGRDHVGPRRVEVVRVRATGRQCDAAHGE